MERVQAAAAGSLSETEQTLGEQVLCSRQMEEAIDLWRRVYENDAPWLEGGRVKGMNLLPAICSEVARLVTLEFDWTVEGSGRAAFLNRQIQPVRQRLRQCLEYAVGKGGMVWKPYLADGKILVEMVQADAFFPLEAGPDGKITSAVFLEQVRQREKWFKNTA